MRPALPRMLFPGEQFIRLANTLQRPDEKPTEEALCVLVTWGAFSCLPDAQITAPFGTPMPHKKTRKRTATFSNGLLDIAAEDRGGFRLRSLALFVRDMCLRWRILKTGYMVGYANAKSP